MLNGPCIDYRCAYAPCEMWAVHMKTEAERGYIGTWARRSRLAAGFTSATIAGEAARAAGIDVTDVYLRGIESGAHRPARELVVQLAAFYDVTPPDADEERDRWLDEIRVAVAEGVEMGLVRALARLSEGSSLPRRGQSR